MKLIVVFLFFSVSCVLAASAALGKFYNGVSHVLEMTNKTISRYRKYSGSLGGQLAAVNQDVNELYQVQQGHLGELHRFDVERKGSISEARHNIYTEKYHEMKKRIIAEVPALLEKYKSLVRTHNKFVATLDKHEVASAMVEEYRNTVLIQMSELRTITSDAITNGYNAFDGERNCFVRKEDTSQTGDQGDKT